MDALQKIGPTAIFYQSTDSDEALISVGGGDGIPYEASSDSKGCKPTSLDSYDHVVPITREVFENLVLGKEPLC